MKMKFILDEDEDEIYLKNLKLAMENKQIERVDCTKFLGLYIDEKLNFKNHVNNLISKLNSIKGMIYSRRQFLPDSARRQIYYALVNSRLVYGVQIYSDTSMNIIEPLHIACNRVLRALQGVSRFFNVKQLYSNYNALPIHLMGNLYTCKIIYKSLNCKSNMSHATSELFSLNHVSHNYATRLSATNHLYKKSGKAFHASFVNVGCTMWNRIPVGIRNSASINIFVKSYKEYLFANW